LVSGSLRALGGHRQEQPAEAKNGQAGAEFLDQQRDTRDEE
jgi:hypothetical protein